MRVLMFDFSFSKRSKEIEGGFAFLLTAGPEYIGPAGLPPRFCLPFPSCCRARGLCVRACAKEISGAPKSSCDLAAFLDYPAADTNTHSTRAPSPRNEHHHVESKSGGTDVAVRAPGKQVVRNLCRHSSLFQSMIELIQPMAVITVMAALPLLLRWVGHFEVVQNTV